MAESVARNQSGCLLLTVGRLLRPHCGILKLADV